VCYTGSVTNVFVQGLLRSFEDALRLLEAALRDCPDELWETDLWPDEAPPQPVPEDAVAGSAPWFLTYHALSTLDYDLTGDFERWEPPPPFHEHVWGWPARVFTKDELLDYLASCRDKARRILDALTEDTASRPLPDTHRYKGTPYGVTVGTLPMHVVEHASQIRQFLTAAGVRPRPRP